MDFHWIDGVIVGCYFVVLLAIGIITFKKTDHSTESYLYASRKLTLPSFVMTLVATWYGAILGIGEMIYFYGIMAWVVNGLLWYGVYFLYAQYIAPKIQQGETPTIAAIFREHTGETAGNIAAIFTAIMTSPAPFLLSLALVIQFLFSSWNVIIPFWIILGGVGIFSGIYIFFHGFLSVIRTDILQFFLLFFGFIALALFCIFSYGFPDFLLQNPNIPESSHLSIPGSMGWQMMIVWGFLALWTFVDPNFYQRCFCAESKKVAQKGILWALFFWFVFDAITLGTGLYALGAFPNADPKMAYLILADAILPFGLKGLFVVAIFSIIMSTIDSFLFTSSTVLAQDFLSRMFPKSTLQKLTKIGILIMILFSIGLALFFQSIMGLIYALGTIGVSLLLPPFLYFLLSGKKIHKNFFIISQCCTFCILAIWMVFGWTHLDSFGFPSYFFGVEPMYPGLLGNIIFISFLIINDKKKS